jgi:heme-degrading monooxygenase HmoA
MFVNIVHFPPIKAGKDAEFQAWFAWSNKQFTSHNGFISRKLLKPREAGNYVGVVEHESYETFMAMQSSPAHAEAHNRVEPLFEGNPTPEFYEVILE